VSFGLDKLKKLEVVEEECGNLINFGVGAHESSI
jgi:hypothetical protein